MQTHNKTPNNNFQSYMSKSEKHAICKVANYSPNLTVGNKYPILTEDENKITIVDDSGILREYYSSRFSITKNQ